VVNDLLTRVKGIFQRLRSKVFPPKNTQQQPEQNEQAKPPASSS